MLGIDSRGHQSGQSVSPSTALSMRPYDIKTKVTEFIVITYEEVRLM